MTMRHAIFALACLAIGTTAMAQAAKPAATPSVIPAAVELTGPARTQALALASAALNQSRAVQGKFLQIAPSGAATQGTFYLQRPGKLRFEYDAPAQMTIVSDGSQVSVQDRALKTDERYPLRATPLNFVLKKNVSLETDGKITKVIAQGGILAITVRDRTGQADGAITMYFDQASKELRQWRVIDGSGAITQVSLTGVRSVASLDSKLFFLKPPPTRRR